MTDTTPFLKLTNEGAHKILAAAVAKAHEIGIPECISVVDPGGHLLCFTKMDGAFVQSIDSSLRKAMTSASYGNPTGLMPEGPDIRLAIATDGKRMAMKVEEIDNTDGVEAGHIISARALATFERVLGDDDDVDALLGSLVYVCLPCVSGPGPVAGHSLFL